MAEPMWVRAEHAGDKPPDKAGVAPDVSVVIVSFNSRRDLMGCLTSLSRQVGVRLEVIVVDNRSTDGTPAWIQKNYPWVQMLALRDNQGYGAANNQGFRRARGRYILVLNPDTELDSGAVCAMARVVEAHPDALVTPKLLRPDGKVNACGMVMQYTGITTCHGYGDNPCRFRGVFPVTLASGAAIMADREVWEALGGFDEHYFLYMEDVELSMRARLGGYPIWCAADAVGLHHYHLGLNPAKFGWLERHRIWTFLKIWSTPTLTRLVPGLLLTEAATWAYAAARGWPYLKARAGAYYWVWQHRRELLKDRRDFQRWRSRDDTDLLSELSVEVPFAQLVASTRMAAHLQAWTTPLYRALKPRDVGLTRTTSGHQPKRPRAI